MVWSLIVLICTHDQTYAIIVGRKKIWDKLENIFFSIRVFLCKFTVHENFMLMFVKVILTVKQKALHVIAVIYWGEKYFEV